MMLERIKETLHKLWTKVKKYLVYILAALAAVLAFVLLGKRKRVNEVYDRLVEDQEKRSKKAQHVIEDVQEIRKDTDEKISEYYKGKRERRRE